MQLTPAVQTPGITPSAPAPLNAWTRIRIWLLEERLATVIDERTRYEKAGLIGSTYRLNSLNQQLDLMSRIAQLKGLPRIDPKTGERQ